MRLLLPIALLVCLLGLGCAERAAQEPADAPPAPEARLRIATWNIRYFPEPSTDANRVAEILAEIDADLVAVQEIRDATALQALLEHVNEGFAARSADGSRTRAYTHRLADSGGNGGLFVGFVYDTLAVELSSVRTVWKLQMTEDLRPALAARVKSRGGGLDFEVIVAHTDSGVRDRDYQNRLSFLDSLAVLLPSVSDSDTDVVLLGDLNTMGRNEEGTLEAVTAGDEIAGLDRRLDGMGLRRLPIEPACTEYYRGRGAVLDHIVVARATEEAPPDLTAGVAGYCAEVDCAVLDPDDMPPDYVTASDHCPVVVDLLDVDLD